MSWLSDLLNPQRAANSGIAQGISTLGQGNDQALAFLREAGDYATTAYRPTVQLGDQSLARLGALEGYAGEAERQNAMAQFRRDPGYQFRLNQGIEAINRSSAGQGSLMSGQTLKALNEFGQGMADQSFNDWYGRQGRLADLGQSATGNTVNARMGAAGNMASTTLGTASNIAQGQAQIGQNNSNNQMNWLGALGSGLGKLFGF